MVIDISVASGSIPVMPPDWLVVRSYTLVPSTAPNKSLTSKVIVLLSHTMVSVIVTVKSGVGLTYTVMLVSIPWSQNGALPLRGSLNLYLKL